MDAMSGRITVWSVRNAVCWRKGRLVETMGDRTYAISQEWTFLTGLYAARKSRMGAESFFWETA
jgi:hypothetical protein